MAEVLITIGIIGIVAAMTIPTLIQKQKEKQTVVQLKQTYSVLSQAIKMAEIENGKISTWFTPDDRVGNAQIFYNNIKPYIKVSKDCGFDEGCFTKGAIKTLDGRDYNNYDKATGEYRVILNNGTALMFFFPLDVGFGNIKVDINNFRGEYAFGKDVFVFNHDGKSLIPAGTPEENNDYFHDYCNLKSTTASNGEACTAWVIYNENMDYLHCDDLSWEGKTKCD